jgi:DnaJ like chaperone protein
MGMIKAQTRFRGYQSRDYQPGRSGKNDLDTAYAALGVTRDSTDAEIKRAYRKLMSENHPDKLIGQGVPEDMIKLATERSQEIQTAYNLIKDARAA